MRCISLALGLIILLIAPNVYAASPFGMQIGQSTLTEISSDFKGRRGGLSQWTQGPIYHFEASAIELAGLTKAVAIFDTDEKIVGLILTLRKDRFDSLNAMAKESYQLKSSKLPFVGDKKVSYLDGDTAIDLISPHMSFEMDMLFIDRRLSEAFETGFANQKEHKAKSEKQTLFGK